jgi:hypothetical protein
MKGINQIYSSILFELNPLMHCPLPGSVNLPKIIEQSNQHYHVSKNAQHIMETPIRYKVIF